MGSFVEFLRLVPMLRKDLPKLWSFLTNRSNEQIVEYVIPRVRYAVVSDVARLRIYPDFNIPEDVCELKQGMELQVEINKPVEKLMFSGWGAILGHGHYLGALDDSGEIGEVRFLDRDKIPVETRQITLPHEAGANAIQIAEANPIVSGFPTPESIRAAGMVGHARLYHHHLGKEFWDHVNLYIQVIDDIPKRSRYVCFRPTEGNLTLVTLHGIRRENPIAQLLSKSQTGNSEISPTHENLAYSYATYTGRMNGIERLEATARDSLDGAKYKEAIPRFAEVAYKSIDLAYSNLPDVSRRELLNRASASFVLAAQCASNASEVELAAKYYVLGFQCMRKPADEDRRRVLQDSIRALEAYEQSLHDGPGFKKYEGMRAWYNLGFLCIQASSDPALELFKQDYFNQAVEWYLQICNQAFNEPKPHLHDLWFALERIQILLSEQRRLGLPPGEMIEKVMTRRDQIAQSLRQHYSTLLEGLIIPSMEI